MYSDPILSDLCAVEIAPGDVAHLVALAGGQFSIARNGQQVSPERWDRQQLTDCAKAFLNYVHLTRRKVVRVA